MATALTPTGVQVPTITTSPIEALDGLGEKWFIKPDPKSEQHRQLLLLGGLGLPVPESQEYDADTTAIRGSGESLSLSLSGRASTAAELIKNTGLLLATVHDALEADDSIPSINPPALDSTTAHPARNFIYRFEDRRSAATNAMYGDLPNDIRPLRDSLFGLVEFIQENGIPPEMLAEEEPSYGDFKPDNLIFKPGEGLFLIDPQLHRGRQINDAAKFCTRASLEPTPPQVDIKSTLLKGYSEKSPVPGDDFEFAWSSALDLSNILSGYLGRLAKGDVKFGLVRQLSDNQLYRSRVSKLITATLTELEASQR